MKIPTTIAELVASFSGINRTPDFKPVTQCTSGCGEPSSGRSTPMERYHGNRRQSTVITVGVDKIPTVSSEPFSLRKSSRSSTGPEVKYRKNRRQSAPCIATNTTCLKEKLSRLRSANSSGDEQDDDDIKEEEPEDFHVAGGGGARKQSVSYRIA